MVQTYKLQKFPNIFDFYWFLSSSPSQSACNQIKIKKAKGFTLCWCSTLRILITISAWVQYFLISQLFLNILTFVYIHTIYLVWYIKSSGENNLWTFRVYYLSRNLDSNVLVQEWRSTIEMFSVHICVDFFNNNFQILCPWYSNARDSG